MKDKVKQWCDARSKRIERHLELRGSQIVSDAIGELINDCIQDLGLSNEWVSVDERLPDEVFDWVIAYQDGAYCTVGYTKKRGFYMPYPFDLCNLNLAEITHWQELPLPPSEDKS